MTAIRPGIAPAAPALLAPIGSARSDVESGAGVEAAPATSASRSPHRLWAFVLLVTAVAAAAHLALVPAPRLPDARTLGLAACLAAGFALTSHRLVHARLGRETFSHSVSEVPLLAGLILLVPADPFALVLARVVGVGLVLLVKDRTPPIKRVFNAAVCWLEISVGLAVWRALLAGSEVLTPRGWLALMGTVLVTSLLSSLLVAMVISLAQGGVCWGSLRALGLNLVASVASASFVLIALFVLLTDWRAVWTLPGLAAGFVLAYQGYTSLQRRQAGLQHVAEFSRRVGGELHSEGVALAVLAQVRQVLQVDVAELVLGEGDDRVRFTLGRDGTPRIDRNGPDGLAEVFVGDRWDRAPVLVPRKARDPRARAALRAAGVKEVLIAPLIDEDRLLGTLLVADQMGDIDGLARHEQALLVAVAGHASVALRNGYLADQLRQEASEKEHQALHDSLTGLPNRTLFRQRLTEMLARDLPLAVLLTDLDQFKEINDTLGHDIGDRLLVEFAERLRRTLPRDAVVARLGGDEFGVAISGATEPEALLAAQALRQTLGRPASIDDLAVEVDVSIGAALAPQHGTDAAVLVQRADVAMYDAKASRSGFEVYAADRDQYSRRRLALVSQLRQAIESGELANHYQPQVDLHSGRVTGVEVLVRWAHPRLGLISPDEFIPIAEQVGLIRPLTLTVLGRALEDSAAWRDCGEDVRLAVNLSPRSLLDLSLPEDVEALLNQHEVPAHVLTLEITENCVMADPVRTSAVLSRLRSIGVQLSMDDFGTGYSSLSYLKRLPVDEIKIDRSFVQSMPTDPADDAIVGTIVELSHKLGKRVVAEGVEEQAAYDRLARLGCDAAQGYWISRPLDAHGLLRWLEAHAPQSAAQAAAHAAVHTAVHTAALPRPSHARPAHLHAIPDRTG